MSVLANAIDTEGNLPEELTARVRATVKLKGHDPIELNDTLSGPRYTGPMGPAAVFGPIAAIVNILARNPMAPVRIEAIDCDIEIAPGRRVAAIESVRLASDRIEPGQDLKASVALKPFKGERQTVEMTLPLPANLAEGAYEADLCDMGGSMRRRLRNEPALLEPRDLRGMLQLIRIQTAPRRTALYLHVPLPERGLAVQGQPLPNLPGSVRAAFSTSRHSQEPPIRTDLIQVVDTPWVVEGSQSLRFTVVKDAGVSVD
jgi:hypothetical protein